jgi:hypothetical protein
VTYPGLGQADIDYAVKELENNEPYVHFQTAWIYPPGRRAPLTKEDLERSFNYSISAHAEDYMIAVPDEDTMGPALREAANIVQLRVGPEYDDVVYRYSGSHDSIAGNSGRGMYVAKLAPEHLRKEGAVQGICIGNENLGHPKALREGKTQVFSIRTPSGKPKFTIELKRDYASKPHGYAIHREHVPLGAGYADEVFTIAEVKGKANRIAMSPDEVRWVTEFLLSLGFTPEEIGRATDVAPGVRSMQEKGVDPFAPPPRKAREPRENPRRSRSVERLIARVRPMGRFRA